MPLPCTQQPALSVQQRLNVRPPAFLSIIRPISRPSNADIVSARPAGGTTSARKRPLPSPELVPVSDRASPWGDFRQIRPRPKAEFFTVAKNLSRHMQAADNVAKYVRALPRTVRYVSLCYQPRLSPGFISEFTQGVTCRWLREARQGIVSKLLVHHLWLDSTCRSRNFNAMRQRKCAAVENPMSSLEDG